LIARPPKPPDWCKHIAGIFNGTRVMALVFEVDIGRNANYQILGAKGG